MDRERTSSGIDGDAVVFGMRSKLRYKGPMLTVFGSVKDLTLNGTGSGTDGSPDPTKNKQSDPVLKENVVRIGDHPAGLGLYLFDYKTEFRDSCGRGRQFGVMADEVERIMPAAVSRDVHGYRQVNYGMLGITLN